MKKCVIYFHLFFYSNQYSKTLETKYIDEYTKYYVRGPRGCWLLFAIQNLRFAHVKLIVFVRDVEECD